MTDRQKDNTKEPSMHAVAVTGWKATARSNVTVFQQTEEGTPVKLEG